MNPWVAVEGGRALFQLGDFMGAFCAVSRPLPCQPVPLPEREVISRLRNCIVALVAQKLALYDTSILYCYEASMPHQVTVPQGSGKALAGWLRGVLPAWFSKSACRGKTRRPCSILSVCLGCDGCSCV